MSSTKTNNNSAQQVKDKEKEKDGATASTDAEQSVWSTSNFLEYIYPGKGQRNLKRDLRKMDIPTFQRTHSLHSMYAQTFQTTPSYKTKQNENTRAAKKIKMQEQKEGMVQESFQPESVLLFLSHLGVSTSEVHIKIAEALRSKLDDIVDRMRLSRASNHEALKDLLIQSWEARDVPQLRPVLVTVIKKLGDRTPPTLLQRLADKDDEGKLKYSELMAQFGLPMRRLVWEADWDKVCAANLDDDSNASKTPTSLISDMIYSHIADYCNDEELAKIADLPIVATISDRKVITQKRRSTTYTTNNTTPTPSIIGKKEDKATSGKMVASADAVSKIKDIVGGRLKLLAAVLHILIEHHGKHAKDLNYIRGNILGGKNYLSCTLVTDFLLSYGQLPKYYEYLGILASVLDESVRSGILSDDAIGQIQGCLRIIFSPSAVSDNKNNETGSQTATSSSLASQRKKYSPKEDKQYISSLLQEVISSAITAMKDADTKVVFLNPVTDAIAPGYSNVIKKPMCILTISQKSKSQQYNSLSDLEKDVDLMFQNCISYNVGDAGAWFRGEAKRQKKMFKESILPQARNIFKAELGKRRAEMEKEYSGASKEEKKKKVGENKQKGDAKTKKSGLLLPNMKNEGTKGKDVAITSLTAADVSPLLSVKIKKRKRERNANNDSFDLPSIPALAAMMLSDPFVVRLISEKLFRTIRVQVLKEKTTFIPSCHNMIPSLFQFLHISQLSVQICSSKGKCTVPDSGLVGKVSTGTEEENESTNSPQFYFLRKYTARYAKLLLAINLDQRTAKGGDLHGSMQGGSLDPLPLTSAKDWKHSSDFRALLVMVEYAFVYLFWIGKQLNETVLRSQLARLNTVMRELSGGDMRWEKPFFKSLVQALVGYKRKMRTEVRDLIIENWLEWFKTSGANSISTPVHEMLVYLLNEWSALGNRILPRDYLLWDLSIKTIEKVNTIIVLEGCLNSFAESWFRNSVEFLPVKEQYERMLKNVSETDAVEWKKKVQIDEVHYKKWKDKKDMNE